MARRSCRFGAAVLGAPLLVAMLFAELAAAQPVELRLSVETPPSHARNLASERWAEAIERLSDGAVTVRVFPSGQLYGSPAQSRRWLRVPST